MKTDSFTDISRNDLNCFLVRLNGMSFSLSHSLTQMSIVSSKGILVNNDCSKTEVYPKSGFIGHKTLHL